MHVITFIIVIPALGFFDIFEPVLYIRYKIGLGFFASDRINGTFHDVLPLIR
jgi:hypothetical protein